jgi:hypothetical protein
MSMSDPLLILVQAGMSRETAQHFLAKSHGHQSISNIFYDYAYSQWNTHGWDYRSYAFNSELIEELTAMDNCGYFNHRNPLSYILRKFDGLCHATLELNLDHGVWENNCKQLSAKGRNKTFSVPDRVHCAKYENEFELDTILVELATRFPNDENLYFHATDGSSAFQILKTGVQPTSHGPHDFGHENRYYLVDSFHLALNWCDTAPGWIFVYGISEKQLQRHPGKDIAGSEWCKIVARSRDLDETMFVNPEPLSPTSSFSWLRGPICTNVQVLDKHQSLTTPFQYYRDVNQLAIMQSTLSTLLNSQHLRAIIQITNPSLSSDEKDQVFNPLTRPDVSP